MNNELKEKEFQKIEESKNTPEENAQLENGKMLKKQIKFTYVTGMNFFETVNTEEMFSKKTISDVLDQAISDVCYGKACIHYYISQNDSKDIMDIYLPINDLKISLIKNSHLKDPNCDIKIVFRRISDNCLPVVINDAEYNDILRIAYSTLFDYYDNNLNLIDKQIQTATKQTCKKWIKEHEFNGRIPSYDVIRTDKQVIGDLIFNYVDTNRYNITKYGYDNLISLLCMKDQIVRFIIDKEKLFGDLLEEVNKIPDKKKQIEVIEEDLHELEKIKKFIFKNYGHVCIKIKEYVDTIHKIYRLLEKEEEKRVSEERDNKKLEENIKKKLEVKDNKKLEKEAKKKLEKEIKIEIEEGIKKNFIKRYEFTKSSKKEIDKLKLKLSRLETTIVEVLKQETEFSELENKIKSLNDLIKKEEEIKAKIDEEEEFKKKLEEESKKEEN